METKRTNPSDYLTPAGVAAVEAIAAEKLAAIRKRAFRFCDPAMAISFRYRCTRPMRAVNMDTGPETDVGEVWVATPAGAAWLERGGYEVVA